MGIWRVRRGEKVLGWQSPVRGPVHPAFVPLFDPSGLGWLEGFDELLCRCGLESNGAPDFDAAAASCSTRCTGESPICRPIALNLKSTKMPAKFLSAASSTKRGFIFTALRLTSTLTTTIGSNEFSWTDEVENIGGRDATMQMLYHFNVGQPLLQPVRRITAASCHGRRRGRK